MNLLPGRARIIRSVRHYPRRLRHGFTLVEVLLASFVISIVIGALFAAFFIPSRAIQEGKAELAAVEEAVIFLYRFTEEVSAAYHQAPDFPFRGDGEALNFFSAAGTDFGLAKVDYRISRETEESVVVYRVLLNGTDEVPVLQAEGLTLAYYDGAEWHDEWQQEEYPPRAISLDLQRRGRQFRIFVAPRADFSYHSSGDSDNGDNDG